MASPVRSAWLDAWEGPSTPSPCGYRGPAEPARNERHAREERGARAQRYLERESPRGQVIRPANATWMGRHGGEVTRSARAAALERAMWPEETLSPVVRLSEARSREAWSREADHEAARLDRPRGHDSRSNRERAKARHRKGGARGRQVASYEARVPERLLVPNVAPIRDYDWEAAARRRPAAHECERVILHPGRSVEARLSSTRYYGREATARVARPLPDAVRREAPPRLRVVKRRVARRRLAVLAVAIGLLLVGSTIVAPMMTSAAVAGVETAVGQTEALQEQLAAETAALAAQISSLSSPQRVAEEAAQLGLAPAQEVSYVSPELSGGPMLAWEGDTTLAGR